MIFCQMYVDKCGWLCYVFLSDRSEVNGMRYVAGISFTDSTDLSDGYMGVTYQYSNHILLPNTDVYRIPVYIYVFDSVENLEVYLSDLRTHFRLNCVQYRFYPKKLDTKEFPFVLDALAKFHSYRHFGAAHKVVSVK